MAVTTGKVRASYVNIFQPKAPQGGGEAKYSVTLLIPKTDTATINSIYAEIEKAKQEGAQKVFGGNIPPMCRIPVHDGDGVKPTSGEPFGEECRGCLVVTASAKMQPSVVGLDMQNIINPAEVYSGCYIRANINFFAYNTNGNKGIGCGLNAVPGCQQRKPLGEAMLITPYLRCRIRGLYRRASSIRRCRQEDTSSLHPCHIRYSPYRRRWATRSRPADRSTRSQGGRCLLEE